MMRVVLLAACSANVVAFLQRPADQVDGDAPLVVSSPPPPSTSSTPACVDIGFPDDPGFKCADEAEACNDTSDLEWYNELRQICAKTCNACGPVTG